MAYPPPISLSSPTIGSHKPFFFSQATPFLTTSPSFLNAFPTFPLNKPSILIGSFLRTGILLIIFFGSIFAISFLGSILGIIFYHKLFEILNNISNKLIILYLINY